MESSQKMESSQTKVCTKCGRELPLSMFGKGNDKYGKRTQCKECVNKYTRDYLYAKKMASLERNPDLARFTPRELISELRARGYEGNLVFTEHIVHKIRV